MVWGCFAWSGARNLVQIDGKMNVNKYIDILLHNLKSSARKIGSPKDWIFQQDNDPKHKAHKTMSYFRQSRVKLMDWPPQSPDLNPMENLWSILDQKMDKSTVTNKTLLFEELIKTWEQLDQHYLQNLFESMPRGLQAVICAKGGHTKY